MKNQKSRLRQQAELPTPGFLLVRERLHILLWLLCPYFSKTTNTTISACWFYESKLFRTTWRNCETITWSSWSQRQTTVSGSRKRGGSPVTLMDASFKVGTLQREWRCWRSGLPAISGIHAVTFFPPHGFPHLPCRGTDQGLETQSAPFSPTFTPICIKPCSPSLEFIYSDHPFFVAPSRSVTYSFFNQKSLLGLVIHSPLTFIRSFDLSPFRI